MRLRDYLALDDARFRDLFRRSPIKRIKRRGFLRNVCVALGNAGTRADLPALKRAAADAEPLIAEHAAWAIAQIHTRLGSGASISGTEGNELNPTDLTVASH
jgi:epoxyqueuosine reductase